MCFDFPRKRDKNRRLQRTGSKLSSDTLENLVPCKSYSNSQRLNINRGDKAGDIKNVCIDDCDGINRNIVFERLFDASADVKGVAPVHRYAYTKPRIPTKECHPIQTETPTYQSKEIIEELLTDNKITPVTDTSLGYSRKSHLSNKPSSDDEQVLAKTFVGYDNRRISLPTTEWGEKRNTSKRKHRKRCCCNCQCCCNSCQCCYDDFSTDESISDKSRKSSITSRNNPKNSQGKSGNKRCCCRSSSCFLQLPNCCNTGIRICC